MIWPILVYRNPFWKNIFWKCIKGALPTSVHWRIWPIFDPSSKNVEVLSGWSLIVFKKCKIDCVVFHFCWNWAFSFFFDAIWWEEQIMYLRVARSRPVYYSILELFGPSSHYRIIKFPLHKPSENLKMCY